MIIKARHSYIYKVLLCLAICVLINQHAYCQHIYLISVGVSDYPGEEHDLRLSASDGKRMKWLYDRNNLAETFLLTDSLATKRRVMAAMQRQYQKATPDDIIVFFFSGHGYNGAFCAYDADITYAEIRSLMAKSQSKHKMIFADACLSGNMRKDSGKNQSGKDADMDVMLFMSSRDNEYSMESSGMVNGYFTTALQQGLRGATDTNRDRIVSAKELFIYVSQAVKELSRDRQHPVMWGKFSDDMPVIVW